MQHMSRSRVTEAFALAVQVHAGQTRKASAIPYIGHVLGVAAAVVDHGGDEDLLIAALLHDAVEDGGGLPRLHEIRQRFGARVAHVVEACSDSFAEDPNAKDPWWQRKVRYVRHLAGVTALHGPTVVENEWQEALAIERSTVARP